MTTPLEFARHHANYDVSATIAIINDPRTAYDHAYTVQRLGNVIGGRTIRYLNLTIDELKDIAIEMIKVRHFLRPPSSPNIALTLFRPLRLIARCGSDAMWTRPPTSMMVYSTRTSVSPAPARTRATRA